MDSSSFCLVPFWEDQSPAYRFRLEVTAINDSPASQAVRIEVEWEDTQYQHLRDQIYVKNPGTGEWTLHPGRIIGTRSVFDLSLIPGETAIAMQPVYAYGDYLAMVKAARSRGTEAELVGLTPGAREYWLLRFRAACARTRKRVLAVSRVHPYETAGSFSAEGIAELLASADDALSLALREQCEVFVVPMANPDGVYEGLVRLTAPGGIDLSRTLDLSDGNCRLLKEVVDQTAPHVYIEFHNWMFKDADGISCLGPIDSRRFQRAMPATICKKWRPMLKWGLFASERGGFKEYCLRQFGSRVACLEYPWFGRSRQDMMRLGMDSLWALATL